VQTEGFISGSPARDIRPWRCGRWLESFGVTINELRDERRVRELLQLWDTLHDDELGEQATMPSSYLAIATRRGTFQQLVARTMAAGGAAHGSGKIAGTAVLAPALHIVADDGKKNHFTRRASVNSRNGLIKSGRRGFTGSCCGVRRLP